MTEADLEPSGGASGEVVLVPTAVVAGGAALAHDADGRVVFVEGALPGERVTVRLTEVRKDFARARAVEILEASPDRVAPPCPALAAGCGGCTWQHVTPEAQVGYKAEIVVDALRRIGRMADPPTPSETPLPGPALRTTARLAVSAGSDRAGHRARHDSRAVETDSCLAAHPLLEELIVDGRYPDASEVLLRVGVASGERLVQVEPAAAAANVQVPGDVLVVGRGDGRPGFVHEEVAGRRFRVSAGSFFQPGPVAAEGLVTAVSEAVGEALPAGGHLVDAYAGVGLLASTLGAARGARVTAVESDRTAVADARVNLADLDARVVRSEVGRWRRRAGKKAPPVDVVVADPSRPGLGRPGVAALVALAAPRLVLVSCDPASLGRDTALLSAAGYRLTSVAMVDAFPHTFHVETVCRFDRASAPRVAAGNGGKA
ncbi:MAG TPA: TRAM domain-containing protein [Acidimicrobiales bacterium]|nr:TRAM domain-containing protein [Acidimicrobiales bacterium]